MFDFNFSRCAFDGFHEVQIYIDPQIGTAARPPSARARATAKSETGAAEKIMALTDRIVAENHAHIIPHFSASLGN